MRYIDAIEMLKPLGIGFFYDDTLKLFTLVLDETLVYLHPADFQGFDVPDMKTWVARRLIQYSESKPIITFH